MKTTMRTLRTLKTNNSQFGSLKHSALERRETRMKKKEGPEFEFFLEELLNEDTRELDEYPVLLPMYGRFWDNGYEDIEKEGEYE